MYVVESYKKPIFNPSAQFLTRGRTQNDLFKQRPDSPTKALHFDLSIVKIGLLSKKLEIRPFLTRQRKILTRGRTQNDFFSTSD